MVDLFVVHRWTYVGSVSLMLTLYLKALCCLSSMLVIVFFVILIGFSFVFRLCVHSSTFNRTANGEKDLIFVYSEDCFSNALQINRVTKREKEPEASWKVNIYIRCHGTNANKTSAQRESYVQKTNLLTKETTRTI